LRKAKPKVKRKASSKAIFLDRDDTLIEDPGYINHPDQVKLLDGVAEALVELRAMGYKLVVVTNQSGVARGIVSEEALDEIHNRLKQLLAEKGAYLDQIYYCPYHPEGVVAKYRKESNMRKPNPGMLTAAAREMDIDFGQSWFIGNTSSDIEAGQRTGCKTILINRSAYYTEPKPGEATADYKSVNIKEAVNIIKKYRRSSRQHPEQPPEPEDKPGPPTTNAPSHQESDQPQPEVVEDNTEGERTEQLLNSILQQLRVMHRVNMFGEFSIMRVLAKGAQIIALFCMVVTVFFLLVPDRKGNSIFIALGFAVLFQLMALTFYIMESRR
jgi:D,D-heptose 1,7-bisphosphate phosphatase